MLVGSLSLILHSLPSTLLKQSSLFLHSVASLNINIGLLHIYNSPHPLYSSSTTLSVTQFYSIAGAGEDSSISILLPNPIYSRSSTPGNNNNIHTNMATGTMRVVTEQQQQQQCQENKGSILNIDLRLTDEQGEYLERQFQKSKNPHPSELMLTAAETGLLEEEVQAWFKQRMAMWRRDQGLNPVSSRIC